jgi:adenylyltransferase/sulfurtransferase
MPIIATVSATQVAEALKILVGDMASLHRSLLQFDVWANDRQAIKLSAPDPECKACGLRKFEFLDAEAQESSAVLCGRNAVQIVPGSTIKIDLPALADKLARLGEVKLNEYLVRFAPGENELTVFKDGRAIIRGTDDIVVARSIYAKYIGN